MIWEHNVTIIVMLTKLKEMGREKCAQYWPIDQSIRYGYFIIEPMGEYHMSQYLLSEFKLTDTRVKKIDLIDIFNNLNVLFCFQGWSISNDSTFSLYRMARTRCTESWRRIY